MAMYKIIVETPKGSVEKYDWNQKENAFELNKILPLGMIFPLDFGFIPHTKGEDGDPLDALLLSELKTFPGCLINARLIGAVTGRQKKKGEWIRNDRFLFVPEHSLVFSNIKRPDQLAKKFLKNIVRFLMTYNVEADFEVISIVSKEKAAALIQKSGHA